jgi:hypothetical protein
MVELEKKGRMVVLNRTPGLWVQLTKNNRWLLFRAKSLDRRELLLQHRRNGFATFTLHWNYPRKIILHVCRWLIYAFVGGIHRC